MLQYKIVLNNRIRDLIHSSRKEAWKKDKRLTAEFISNEVGHASSWLAQIENGRLKTIKSTDLVDVFCVINGKDKNCADKDRQHIIEYLDDKIMYINATSKLGIYDDDGNVLDFTEMLSFESARGHIKYAGKKLGPIFFELLNLPLEDIQKDLQSYIRYMFSNVINWFNRAFSDTAELFSDEISTINLFLLIDTSINLYNGHFEYFGLNILPISEREVIQLKEKLNDDYFLKPRTVIKPINEYTFNEFDEVALHFSTEEYMMWKNKRTYIGEDKFPMLIKFQESLSDSGTFKEYADVNTATGLEEQEYLYMMKQLYTQIDILFNKYKILLSNYKEYQEDNELLSAENEELKKRLNEHQ